MSATFDIYLCGASLSSVPADFPPTIEGARTFGTIKYFMKTELNGRVINESNLKIQSTA